MNDQSNLHLEEHEKYFELCALAPTGELSAEEWRRLDEHVKKCRECRELLAIYSGPALNRMAALGADPTSDYGGAVPVCLAESELGRVREEILAQVSDPRRNEVRQASAPDKPSLAAAPWAAWREIRVYLGTAALFLLAVSVAYQYGHKQVGAQTLVTSTSSSQESALRAQIANLSAERQALDQRLAQEQQTINALTERQNRKDAELAEVKNRSSFLTAQNQKQAEGIASATDERNQLLARLDDTDKSLKAVRDELNAQREQHQKTMLRTASLESEIGRLSAQLQQKDETIGQQSEYLVADRDVRELMGARQLYIADVFDVDGGGRTRKPFGRVFYTKGKSLLFYAFDLDQTSGYKQAKAFQAWGREGQDGAKPVSLGIFYLDNESNRRWVLKSEDPKALEQIDAVFVTVEPNGGSVRPSGKPFLYAYLHKTPLNHP